MKSKGKSPRLVELVWDDHWGQQGWRGTDDIDHTPMRCRSVGYLVKETKLGFTLAGTLADGQWNTIMFRMRKCVISVRTVRR